MANTKNELEQAQPLLKLNNPCDEHGSSEFYNLPSGQALTLIRETIAAGSANIADMPARKRQVSHHAAKDSGLTVTEKGKVRQVTYTTKKAEITLELSDINLLSGCNKPAKKLFPFTLVKMNQHGMYSGELKEDHISFPLQELIDHGMYQNIDTARQGFKKGMEVLTSFKIQGRIQKTKNISSSQEQLRVLFTGYDIKNNHCTVYFNTHIDWRFLVQYWTLIPKYYFSLPSKASDLFYHIFVMANMTDKRRKIASDGCFTLSMRDVHRVLNLPSEHGNREPGKTIKQPIKDAISDITDAHEAYFNNHDFIIEPVYDDSGDICNFLDNGYLIISLKGSFAKRFIQISKETDHRIANAKKRQQRIIEQATALKIANSDQNIEAVESNA